MAEDNEDKFELDLDLEEPIEFAKKKGLQGIEELIAQAHAAINEAKKIADEENLRFTFNLGEVSSTYHRGNYTHEGEYWESSSAHC